MASFGTQRREAFDRAAARSQRAQFMGLSAWERHTRLLSSAAHYDGGAAAAAPPMPTPATIAAGLKTDAEILRDSHRFIRSEEEDADGSWEARLARRYYARLFREYAVADLSMAAKGRIGLRWRVDREVVSGKGQFVCGAKGCDEGDGLCSYEVNFAYEEAGESKAALVKLRVCEGCARLLNARKEKQYRKAVKRLKRRTDALIEEVAEETDRKRRRKEHKKEKAKKKSRKGSRRDGKPHERDESYAPEMSHDESYAPERGGIAGAGRDDDADGSGDDHAGPGARRVPSGAARAGGHEGVRGGPGHGEDDDLEELLP